MMGVLLLFRPSVRPPDHSLHSPGWVEVTQSVTKSSSSLLGLFNNKKIERKEQPSRGQVMKISE